MKQSLLSAVCVGINFVLGNESEFLGFLAFPNLYQ